MGEWSWDSTFQIVTVVVTISLCLGGIFYAANKAGF